MRHSPTRPARCRRLLSGLCLALCATLATPLAHAETMLPKPIFVERLATRDTLAELRKGGYVLYLRHGYTDNTRPDRFPDVDLNDCATQRQLSDGGRNLMREVGKAMRKAALPIGEILVSPLCRTRESAELAIGDKFQTVEDLMYTANMTSEEKKPRLETLRKLLTAPLPPGKNRLLVAHAPNLADLIGFFVKPEGTLVIFAQRGENGYQYVASIPPSLWNELLRQTF